MKKLIKLLTDIGGTPCLVGGAVIDRIQGREIKDWDIEVFGVSLSQIQKALEDQGFSCDLVGAHFGVLKTRVGDLDIDLSVPRRENKVGVGHAGFEVEFDPTMTPKDAARRRDLTINSISINMVTDSVNDPFQGLKDLEGGILRATDPKKFSEDPLRVLRVAQLLARKGKTVESSTIELCRSIVDEFESIPCERVFEEFNKLLLKASKPSVGLNFLRDCGWIKHFPELNDLIGCEQNPVHHPEGWSIDLLSNSPILFDTSSAQTLCTEKGALFDCLSQLILSSTTLGTSFPSLSSTSKTQPILSSGVDSLPTAEDTRLNQASFSPETSITVHTQPSSFVFSCGRPTLNADKSLRIMFKISLSSMKTVMRSAINDFQIFDSIISLVSIDMMNMFAPEQPSSNFEFHNNAMESNEIAIASCAAGIDITSFMIVDSAPTSINSDVVVAVDVVFKRNFDFTHIKTLLPEYNSHTNQICQVQKGDVWEHTMRVIDYAAACRDRDVDEDWILAFMFGMLLHDVGKPSTTKDDLTSFGHEGAGVPLAESFMRRLTNDINLITKVNAIVGCHMRVRGLVKSKSKNSAWKRLHNKLRLDIGAVVSACDSQSRSDDPFSLDDDPNAQEAFKRFNNWGPDMIVPILKGRHLIAKGLKPGKEFSVILKAAYSLQIDHDITDLDELFKLSTAF